MTKTFRLASHQIRPLLQGRQGCFASDRITVDGAKVGYMYRKAGNEKWDSGWSFFAGDEDDEYCAKPGNFEIYSLNTIANYDPSIIPFLDVAAPCAFERNEEGGFVAVMPTFEC